jgi:transcription initiation factor TFIIH subunit 4
MNAFNFLEELPAVTVDRVYDCPWTCQAVYQSLPILAKHYVMRLLCVQEETKPNVRGWVRDSHLSKHNAAIEKLVKVRFFLEAERSYRLNPKIKIKEAMSSPHKAPWENSVKLGKDKKAPTLIDLEEHAHTKWNAILHFIVQSGKVPPPAPKVQKTLVAAGLMHLVEKRLETGEVEKAFAPTSAGFEFMLMDVHEQMWTFMREYIRNASELQQQQQQAGGAASGAEIVAAGLAERDHDDVLMFLFQLSYCRVGDYYPVEALTPAQQLLLEEFTYLGILFRRKKKSKRFYTTRLAVDMLFGAEHRHKKNQDVMVQAEGNSTEMVAAGGGTQHGAGEGFELKLIVETNFRVYAFTTSVIHIYLLSVFVDIKYRLPNMAVGDITRASVRDALFSGISAAQMVNFLVKHAHPRMRMNNPVIPHNVTHQLELWEQERCRVTKTPCVLYDNFADDTTFDMVRQYADELRVVVWANRGKRKLAVRSEAAENMRKFINKKLRSR